MTYNNQEEADELIKEMIEGKTTLPPGGSVFQSLHEKEGAPPVARMLGLQGFFAIAARLGWGVRAKVMLIVVVCLYFALSDYGGFLQHRKPNVYEQIGLDRSAS
jgi:hypothetical protein